MDKTETVNFRRITQPCLLWLVSLMSVLMITACASLPASQRAETIPAFRPLYALIDQAGVRDARYQRIDDFEFYGVDLGLRHLAKDYSGIQGLSAKKAFAERFLQQAQQVDLIAMQLNLSRLPEARLAEYRRNHLPALRDNADIYPVYQQQAVVAHLHQQQQLQTLSTELQMDAWWQRLTANIEESILTRGRVMRQLLTAPAVPFVKGWIAYHEATDPRGPMRLDFSQAEVYRPVRSDVIPALGNRADWALLLQHAPNIVHEINSEADYAISNDRFGEVSLQGSNLDEAVPQVDTQRPTVYAYVERKQVQGLEVRQLVYTFWHPAHPKLSTFDPEAGIMDGWTIRMTLGADDQVLDFESISNCGCYYKNFPSTELEAMARHAFTQPLPEKQFFIENTVAGQYDAIVPELVAGLRSDHPNDSWLYFSAGHHQLVTVRSSATADSAWAQAPAREYVLQPYERLESLPFNGYSASVFDTNGLVRTAHRPECTMLTPSGLYHAGHARQRGTQMIYFDEAVFDAPDLLETYLRLPTAAFGKRGPLEQGNAYGRLPVTGAGS